MPLPERDFDPSEAAVSWSVLTNHGIEVAFATPQGAPSEGDSLMLTGRGLDLWSRTPALAGVQVLGLLLRADATARREYTRMIRNAKFRSPLAYSSLEAGGFDGLLLPGGHCAAGMRPYLENPVLQGLVAQFFDTGKPVAAICHGVLLAARSVSSKTGKSVLFGRKTTALTWKLERAAWTLMKLAGRRWDADYYRTYTEKAGEPEGHWSVQSEVTRALESSVDFLEPARFVPSSGLFRDSISNSSPAFVVRDANYVSARWPGDAHRFAMEFASLVEERD